MEEERTRQAPVKLLLHTCCSICFLEPFKDLKNSGFDVTSFYYNPNIQPYEEYLLRLDTLKHIINKYDINLIVPNYNSTSKEDVFFKTDAKTRDEQCSKCYTIRLTKTVKEANSRSIKYFSTTLLGSPFQKKEMILKVAKDLAEKNNLNFVYKDEWPSNYFKSRNEIKASGYYSQKYCGCIYSKMDRKLETRK